MRILDSKAPFYVTAEHKLHGAVRLGVVEEGEVHIRVDNKEDLIDKVRRQRDATISDDRVSREILIPANSMLKICELHVADHELRLTIVDLENLYPWAIEVKVLERERCQV